MALTGGDRMQRVLHDISVKLQRKQVLRAGFLEGATYPDGETVAQVAAYNEFGTATQPPRPFFRGTIQEHQHEWGNDFAGILKAADYNQDLALRRMGELIKGDIQNSISKLNSPPLAQSTIDRKGFDKPLVDTGHMMNSVDYDVEGQ